MVGTTITERVRAVLPGQTHRFLFVDDHGRLCVSIDRLADLITDIVTDLTSDLVRESDLREQEIIALTVERDKALDQVAELESAPRRAGYGEVTQ